MYIYIYIYMICKLIFSSIIFKCAKIKWFQV